MSQAAIRAQLKAICAAVDDVGAVHDYRRFSNEFDRYLELFKVTIDRVDQIRGVMIGYAGFDPDPYVLGDPELRAHRFILHVLLRVDDSAESEKTAAALCESIADGIVGDATLSAQTSYMGRPVVSMPTFEERVFGSVACHYGELLITVSERV
jgi:hypothetical protein